MCKWLIMSTEGWSIVSRRTDNEAPLAQTNGRCFQIRLSPASSGPDWRACDVLCISTAWSCNLQHHHNSLDSAACVNRSAYQSSFHICYSLSPLNESRTLRFPERGCTSPNLLACSCDVLMPRELVCEVYLGSETLRTTCYLGEVHVIKQMFQRAADLQAVILLVGLPHC